MATRIPLRSCNCQRVTSLISTRTYATTVSINHVKVQSAPTPVASVRKYPLKKAYLYDVYMNMLKTSSVLLFLQHNNLKVAEFRRTRKDLGKIPGARLEVLNVGIFSSVLKSFSTKVEDDISSSQFRENTETTLVTSHLPKLAPELLNLCIGPLCTIVLDSASETTPKDIGRIARLCLKSDHKLMLLGALMDARLLDSLQLKAVAKLPGVDVLRSEIAGLVSLPAYQLISVLERARGGSLSLVLEGLKKKLGEEQNVGK